MSDDNVEVTVQPIDDTQEPQAQVPEAVEAETPEAALPEETKAESETPAPETKADELPLPVDEAQQTGKTLPKWVEKKLSRKEQELAQKEQEAAAYRAELERLHAQGGYHANPNTAFDNDPGMPNRANFMDEGQYVSAVFDYKAAKQQAQAQHTVQAQQQKAQQAAMLEANKSFIDKWEAAKEEGAQKYSDFDEKVSRLDDKSFPTNRAMAEAIVDSKHGNDMLYFLGTNETEARRIASLTPVQAVKEIARLEARFDARQQPAISKAPPPIDGIKTNAVKGVNINSLMELSKNSEKMSQAEFEAQYKKLSNGSGERWGV